MRYTLPRVRHTSSTEVVYIGDGEKRERVGKGRDARARARFRPLVREKGRDEGEGRRVGWGSGGLTGARAGQTFHRCSPSKMGGEGGNARG